MHEDSGNDHYEEQADAKHDQLHRVFPPYKFGRINA